MKKITLWLAAACFFITANALAHSGQKKEPAPVSTVEEPAVLDPMYAAQEKKESDPLGNDDSDLFSPSDLFTEGEIAAPDPVANTDMKMEGSHNDHDDHNMPKVEKAKHKVVETSAKGYGMAAGITFFAGIIFAGLTFLKPGE
ncbi:MAG: hypothetical protein VW455_13230 [Nitrospinota bacterium]